MVIVAILIGMSLFGLVIAPPRLEHSLAAPDTAAERQKLEQELEVLEGQINQYEKTISEYRRQGNSLKSEISTLEAKISKINLQIKAVTLSLEKLNKEIAQNESQILTTEEKIKLNKGAISSALQNVYEIEDQSLVAILLQSQNLTNFFGSINNLLDVQVNLIQALEEISRLKQQLLTEKEELALKKRDTVALKAYQDQQKAVAAKTTQDKKQILEVTKGQEQKYQVLLTETKKTAAEIRNRLFELLGGGEITFEQAYNLAKMASGATGVRPALILAVLDRESALGQNVGKCKYDVNPYYPSRASNPTAMHPTRDIPIFLEITRKLGLDPGTIQVSCPIPSDGAYGGAMGTAQFIPSTWALYETEISRITGASVPSPWNNAHAFVATALYLKDAYNSSGCREYANQIPAQATMLRERCAAAKYYAGGSWYKYRFLYGDAIVTRANGFEQDIQVLSQG